MLLKKLLFYTLLSVFIGTVFGQQPNIILIMTDDQGYGDLGVHGNPDLATPKIDSFADEAISFNQFCCSPVCAPTRSSLLTGRYNYRTQVNDTFKGRALMHPDEVTIAEILKNNGYNTGIYGKWHLGDNYPMRPQDQGFNDVLVHLGGGIGQASDPEGGSSYFDPILQHNGVQTKFEGYCMDVYTDHALDFIEQNQSKPFFLYLATNTPHKPWIDVPSEFSQPYFEKGLSNNTSIFYGMVGNIDYNFGRVVEKVDELGLEDNTIIIFMSDNGQDNAGSDHYKAGLRGRKAQVYENGLRVPFFIRWPDGYSKNGKIETMAAHIDILPTLLDACNISLPDTINFDGRSLLPLITEENPDWPDRGIPFQAHRGDEPHLYQNSAIRTQEWKLINNRTYAPPSTITPDYELYNLANDPGENNNLASTYPELVDSLSAEYLKWFNDVTSTRPWPHHPVHIGTIYENPTILSGQDMREASSSLENDYWSIDVIRPCYYNIILQFDSALNIDVNVYCKTAELNIQGVLPAGTKDFTFERVMLKSGQMKLATFRDNSSPKTTKRTIIERLTSKDSPKKAFNPIPENESNEISIGVKLTWNTGNINAQQKVYLGTQSELTEDDLKATLYDSVYIPEILPNNTTYYWRIDQINDIGITVGDIWIFTTEAYTKLPEKANNPFPESEARVENNIQLTWKSGNSAFSHNIYLGKTNPPDFVTNQIDTFFIPEDLEQDVTYYWRIDEVNTTGVTEGDVWTFITDIHNLAPLADVSVSSESFIYKKKNLVDGNYTNKWISNEATPWAQFDWDSTLTTNKIVFYESASVDITAGKLTFSDGSFIDTDEMHHNGTPYIVTFSDKSINWVRFQINSGNANKMGLAEFELYGYFSGETAISDNLFENMPREYCLEQNYPNPFNPNTNIDFAIPENSFVSLIVYNMLGERIKTLLDQKITAGYHNSVWDGTNDTKIAMANGIYFYKLKSDIGVETKKMVLMK